MPHFLSARQIFTFVCHENREASDGFGRAARVGHDLKDVGKRLVELVGEPIAHELAGLVPSNLPGDTQNAPFTDDTVAVATRWR